MTVEEVHVHLHLPEILVGELAELEVDEDEAAKAAPREEPERPHLVATPLPP